MSPVAIVVPMAIALRPSLIRFEVILNFPGSEIVMRLILLADFAYLKLFLNAFGS